MTNEAEKVFGAMARGEHITTQWMLKQINHLVEGGQRVLDIGTGAGVLAFAAADHHAQVTPVEIKPEGRDIFAEAADLHGCSEMATAHITGTVYDYAGPAVDVVLRNTDDPTLLADDAQTLAKHLKHGGILIGTCRADGFTSTAEPALEKHGLHVRRVDELPPTWTGFIAVKEH